MQHNKKKCCFIWAGDFNIILIDDPLSKECLVYKSLAAELMLIPPISKPTRDKHNLDHFIVRNDFEAV